MKQLLLATASIALPVAVFSGVEHYVVAPADSTVQTATLAPAQGLGDLSALQAIVADTQTLAQTDLVAAETRITDLETAWDDRAKALRAQAPVLWGNVDASADAAFSALRDKAPDRARVLTALSDLSATLADPTRAATPEGAAQTIGGIAVTDAAGPRAALRGHAVGPARRPRRGACLRCSAADQRPASQGDRALQRR
ncbi:hypothetical protein [Salipiger aestuarii]|uniref:hypothetical protein n=1 Tax=Salipiger aestuarii TaxID=568098 RepID=UPI0016809BDA|nr:hypothetical protein [Salipiger aestuarii]